MNNNIMSNPVFWSSLTGMLIAQFIKPFISLICGNGWNPKMLFSNGGMPSSHTSTICAMATSAGLSEGFGSTIFIVATVMAFIVMNDAFNVRLETGRQSEVLNEWANIFSEMFHNGAFTRKKFKTMVGHTVLQVFWGMIIGILTGIAVTAIFHRYA